LPESSALDFLNPDDRQATWLDDENDIESQDMAPSGLKFIRDSKIRLINMMRKEHLRDVLDALPEPGQSIHMVSNGRYDFWTWIPVLIELMGGRADEFFGSTWTLSRPNAREMLQLFDAGTIGQITMMTGTYFKRRETAVYATLLEGLQARGQRYVAFENHAKITLLCRHDREIYLTVEGSANFNANPRVEQYVLTHHRGLYDFHREWMEGMFKKGQKRERTD
jgi:hypothetical protein